MRDRKLCCIVAGEGEEIVPCTARKYESEQFCGGLGRSGFLRSLESVRDIDR